MAESDIYLGDRSRIQWGPGNGTPDLELRRSAAGTLEVVTNGVAGSLDPSTLSGTTERAADLGNLGATETIDLANGGFQKGTLNANCTITMPAMSGAAKASSFTLVLVQDATGGRTVTWVGVDAWPNGVEPSPSAGANQRDTWVFKSYLGGAWEGSLVEANVQ